MSTESVACGQNSTRVLFSQRRPVGRSCSRLLRPCARPSIRAPQSSGATPSRSPRPWIPAPDFSGAGSARERRLFKGLRSRECRRGRGVFGVCGAYLLKSYRMTASVAMPEPVTHLSEDAIRSAP